MCDPITISTIATIAISSALSVAGHKMQEDAKEGARDHATNALAVERNAEDIRQGEEARAAEAERSKISRKSRVAQSQIETMGAARGTSASNALAQAHGEFEMREGEYQSAVSAKRDHQLLAGNVRDAGRVSKWQGTMMANASSGLGGYLLAAATGGMQGYTASGGGGPTEPDVSGAFNNNIDVNYDVNQFASDVGSGAKSWKQDWNAPKLF